jgi:hypothetical protein
MADDIWTGLVKGALAFGHTRAAGFVGDSFKDTGAFVSALSNDPIAQTPDTKARFDKLKQDISNAADAAKPVVEAIKPKINDAKTAVVNMAGELATNPFTIEAAARAATELAFVLIAVDEALYYRGQFATERRRPPAIKDAITNMPDRGSGHSETSARAQDRVHDGQQPWTSTTRRKARVIAFHSTAPKAAEAVVCQPPKIIRRAQHQQMEPFAFQLQGQGNRRREVEHETRSRFALGQDG